MTKANMTIASSQKPYILPSPVLLLPASILAELHCPALQTLTSEAILELHCLGLQLPKLPLSLPSLLLPLVDDLRLLTVNRVFSRKRILHLPEHRPKRLTKVYLRTRMESEYLSLKEDPALMLVVESPGVAEPTSPSREPALLLLPRHCPRTTVPCKRPVN
jgi:hypothetical protein